MTLLFDIPEQKPVKTEKRCRDCQHIFSHLFSRKLWYCEMKRQRATATGAKKVKRLDNICEQFEAKKPQPKISKVHGSYGYQVYDDTDALGRNYSDADPGL